MLMPKPWNAMKLKPIAELVHRALTRHMVRIGAILPALALEIDKAAHGALPEAQRTAVVLRYYEQLEYDEIAALTGAPLDISPTVSEVQFPT